ncbi:hydroxymethylglutaryl CoA reductase [Legionella beliardensis]|uniref:3-hydroxy-3-methylglutaryl coenzyme A reductase n=1 Tax=Legionella beliardensis TaxID=91822 RepID=A0A378I3G9_9GAMM|nr:hydroxymethylglutaryl-CoA reductase, degradative [Legionella beliardensis]STX29719.1 hydroxymethylglutaryl CoA reductase [Legionella beliardensis]
MKAKEPVFTNIIKLSEGFSKLTRKEREQCLIKMGFLTSDDVQILNQDSALSASIADNFIENMIGCFQIPLGVATNFVIDGKNYVIPMVTEETSIIASASKTAKWIRDTGELTTKNLGQFGIGQIQLPRVKNFAIVKEKIQTHKNKLIAAVNDDVAKGIVSRGGGVRDITIRCLPRGDGNDMAVVHVMVDTRDAMGANIINQVCEFLKLPIEDLTAEKVGMCILTNLADTKLTQAKVVIRNIDIELGEAIAEGSLFAQIDPYRAATNNKGVLNGIDAVLIATGNDWRAVEAGIHAYAGYSGQYSSITKWFMKGPDLHGVIEAPIMVGTVGGITQLHPVAKICLKMLNIHESSQLARILLAVGLVQNLGAIKALVTEGINKGHMRLHISNLILASDATQAEVPFLKQHLVQCLETQRHVTGSDVKEILNKMRCH